MRSKIKSQEGDGVVLIPKNILEQAKLEISTPITIEVSDGKIVIEALEKARCSLNLPFSEEHLLQDLDAYGAHSDEIFQCYSFEW
ncbi:hypothetical protein [Bermanella sp. R86510]|uniref:AbrB/MazE/SpoVT family DNA-binding domain-containing protein n=1 Tax=unclassified Bermanella TaxID=2627862 RepID=UPI0037C51D62